VFKVVLERVNDIDLDGNEKIGEVSSHLLEYVEGESEPKYHPMEHDHYLSFSEFFIANDYSKPKNLFKSMSEYVGRYDLLKRILDEGHYFVEEKRVDIKLHDLVSIYEHFNVQDENILKSYVQDYVNDLINNDNEVDEVSNLISRLIHASLVTEDKDEISSLISAVLKP
jgi:hypothetical protein